MLLYGSCSVSDTPDVWQCVRSIIEPGFCAPNSVMMRAHEQARGAQLRDLHEEVHADREEEREAARRTRRCRGRASSAARAYSRPSASVNAELLHRGRAGFLHVVAGDRDRVELRHVLRRVLDDVGDDPHARLGRVDVGVADHELFEDVVLDGPAELRPASTPCSSAGDDVAGEHRQHRAVHRHRHGHLVERDAVEEDLHVLDRVDRDAGLADVADDARVVAVVAAVRREVERDRQTHLPGGEVLAVEGVRLLGGREAGVLADRPRPVRVHRRPRRRARTARSRAARRRSRGPRGRRRCRAA